MPILNKIYQENLPLERTCLWKGCLHKKSCSFLFVFINDSMISVLNSPQPFDKPLNSRSCIIRMNNWLLLASNLCVLYLLVVSRWRVRWVSSWRIFTRRMLRRLCSPGASNLSKGEIIIIIMFLWSSVRIWSFGYIFFLHHSADFMRSLRLLSCNRFYGYLM